LRKLRSTDHALSGLLALCVIIYTICCCPILGAQNASPEDSATSSVTLTDILPDSGSGGELPGQSPPAGDSDWVHKWLHIVDTTRAKQPHTAAPLITTHVALVQQYRFDTQYQEAGGVWTANYGSMKGLEIIPNTRMEVQVGIPPYISHQAASLPDGFGDVSVLLKFRAFSATEGEGDYFVGFFLGGSFPSGTPPAGLGHSVWTPMIAASKGWGNFDIQSTLGGTLPGSGTNVLGRQVVFNNTAQYHLGRPHLWPEMEANSTFFVVGPHAGESQLFLTPGLLVGPFELVGRLHFTFGGGIQIAATQFHLYQRRWIWSARFPF